MDDPAGAGEVAVSDSAPDNEEMYGSRVESDESWAAGFLRRIGTETLMDLDKPRTYQWSVDEWNRDVAHRESCRVTPCDDISHQYQKAIDTGRVYVDGEVVKIDRKLTRLTVLLTENGHASLLTGAKITGEIRTDVVNAALALYAFIAEQGLDNWEPALKRGDDVRTFKIEQHPKTSPNAAGSPPVAP